MRKHNAVCEALARWCEQRECSVDREVLLPTASDASMESRMDLVIRAPGIIGQILVDVTIVNACSREALQKGAGLRDGVAAAIAARRKRDKYCNIPVVPFALEEHGRLGADAIALARRLAPLEGPSRSEAIRQLYQAVAAASQRIAADGILSATCARA